MSQISAAPLRTTYWVFQIGSKLARSACGTKRSVRAAARWEIAGVARTEPDVIALAPAATFRNVRRSICLSLPSGPVRLRSNCQNWDTKINCAGSAGRERQAARNRRADRYVYAAGLHAPRDHGTSFSISLHHG